MVTRPADTLSIRRQFKDLNSLLLKAMASLAQVEHPKALTALQDLKNISDYLWKLQGGVSGNLQTGKRQLTALVGVGHVINSSLGLQRVLEEVMDQLIALMQAERGFLMLRDEQSGELKVRIARGMGRADLEGEAFAFSRTIVRQVIATGEPVLTTNAQGDSRFEKEASIVAMHLRSILCAPLKRKEEIIGVIFVDNRELSDLFQESDLALLTAFADQAAVAIDNARLFEDLQTANQRLEAANRELEIAYDATLQGWVRALDLRDKETEGHTKRVTTLSVELGKALDVASEDLVHIMRGALLHDIGKMAIPDSILLKPGELSPEERELVKQHPRLAYEMLSPIEFLRPAIDIPYCHHEKWDGSGYPRGLAGEDIPLKARIFSIVDVWDALTSHRPYREPMLLEDARQYIGQQAGTHFDPQIARVFLNSGLACLP